MKPWSLLLVVVAVVTFVSLLSIWFVTSKTDFVPGNTLWNGVSRFQNQSGAKDIESLSNLPVSVESAALITTPSLPYADTEKAQLKDFVTNGGTLVLADDFGYGNQLLEYLGVAPRFDGRTLMDPLFCYRNAWLPKITDFGPEVAQNDLSLVVLNHATALNNVSGTAVLARSSPTSFLDTDGNGQQNAGEPEGPFPVAASVKFGSGRLVLLANPSVMVNGMAGNNDNYKFVQTLANPGKSTAQSVFLDAGHLPKSTVDVAQTRLARVRDWVTQPYPLLSILCIIFVGTSALVLKR